MPTALEKILTHAGRSDSQAVLPLDPAAELVLVASVLADELQVLLAGYSDDDDDDSGGSSKSGGDDDSDDDEGEDQMAAMVAKLVKKGIPKPKAVMMAKQAMKRVKASSLAEGIAVALSHLDMSQGTPASVRAKLAAAARDARSLSLSGTQPGEHMLRLAVLTTAERRRPSAHTIGDSTDYPIPDKVHLSAAVARYKQGKLAGHPKDEVRRHILSRARALGEQVDLED